MNTRLLMSFVLLLFLATRVLGGAINQPGNESGTSSTANIPSCSNATTSKLLYNNTTSTFTCGTDQTGGGGGTPGGSDTQIQFNDSSAFGGDAGLTYNKTTDVLTQTGNGKLLVMNQSGGNEVGIILNRSTLANDFANIFYQTGGVNAWTIGLRSTDSSLYIRDEVNSIAVLKGVVGGGIELAATAKHIYLRQTNADNGWKIGGSDSDGSLHIFRRGEGGSPTDNERFTMDTTGLITLGVALPLGSGGTGVTSAADDTILVSNGSVFQAKALPSCSAATSGLAYATASNAFSCNTFPTGSGTTNQIPLWTGSTTLGDSILTQGTNLIQQYSGTSAQGWELYNTRTDASNYERFEAKWSGNVVTLKTTNAGTGVARNLTVSSSVTTTLFGLNVNFQAPNTEVALSSASGTTGRIQIGNSVNLTTTSGTDIDVLIGTLYQPTATSTMASRALQISPYINYSNGTPGAGSYELIRFSPSEVALPTGQNYHIRGMGGLAGTTDTWGVAKVAAATSVTLYIGGAVPATPLGGSVFFNGVTFANLGTPSNGTIIFCTDCDPPTLVDSTCAHSGAQTGSLAIRQNGAWKCIS